MSGIFRTIAISGDDASVSSSQRPPVGPPLLRGRSTSTGGPPTPGSPSSGSGARSSSRRPSPSLLSRGETPPSRRSSPSPQRTKTNVDEYGGSSWAEVSMPAKQKSFRGLSETLRRCGDSSVVSGSQYTDNESITSASFIHDSEDDTTVTDKESSVSESTHGGYSAAGIRVGSELEITNLLPKGRRRPGYGKRQEEKSDYEPNQRAGSTPPLRTRENHQDTLHSYPNRDDHSNSSALSADRAAGAKAVVNTDHLSDDMEEGPYGQPNQKTFGHLSEFHLQRAQLSASGDESTNFSGTTLTRSEDLNSRVQSASNHRKVYASSVRSARSARSHASWRSGRSAASSSTFFSQSQISDQVSEPSEGSSHSGDAGEEGSIPSDGSSVKSASELRNMFHKPNATQREVAHLSQSSRWNAQTTRSGSLSFNPKSQAAMAQQWRTEPQASTNSVLDSLTDAGKETSSLASAKALGRKVGTRTNNRATAIGRSSAAVHLTNRYGGTVTTRKQAAASLASSDVRLSTIESLSQSTGPVSKSSDNSSSFISSAESQTDRSSSMTTNTNITGTSRSTARSSESRGISSDDRSRSDDDDSHSSRSESEYSSETRSYSTRETKDIDSRSYNDRSKLPTVYSESESGNQSGSGESRIDLSGDHTRSVNSDNQDRPSQVSKDPTDEFQLSEEKSSRNSPSDDDLDGGNMTPAMIAAHAAKKKMEDDELTQQTADTEDRKNRHNYLAYADKLRYSMNNNRSDSGNSVVSSVLSDLPNVPPREQGLVPDGGAAKSRSSSQMSDDVSMFDHESQAGSSHFQSSNFENSTEYDDRSAMMHDGQGDSARSFMTEMTDMDESQVITPVMTKQEEEEFQQRKVDLENQRQRILSAAAAAGLSVSSRDKDSSSMSSRSYMSTGQSQQSSIVEEPQDEKSMEEQSQEEESQEDHSLDEESQEEDDTPPSKTVLAAKSPYMDSREENKYKDINSEQPSNQQRLYTVRNTTEEYSTSPSTSFVPVEKKEPLIIDHDRKKTMLQSLSDLHRLQKVVSDLTLPADLESAHGSMRSGLSYPGTLLSQDPTMDKIPEREMEPNFSSQASQFSESSKETCEVKHRIDDELAACKELLSGSKRASKVAPNTKYEHDGGDTEGSRSSEEGPTSASRSNSQEAARLGRLKDGDAAAGAPLYDEVEDQESDSGWTSESSNSYHHKTRPRGHVPFQRHSAGVEEMYRNRVESSKTLDSDSTSVDDSLDVDFPSAEKRASFRRDAPQDLANAAAISNAAYELDSRNSDSEDDYEESEAFLPDSSHEDVTATESAMTFSTFDSSLLDSSGNSKPYDDDGSHGHRSAYSHSSVGTSSVASSERRPLRRKDRTDSQGSMSLGNDSQSNRSRSSYGGRSVDEHGLHRSTESNDYGMTNSASIDERGRVVNKQGRKVDMRKYGFADDGMVTGSDDESHDYDENERMLRSGRDEDVFSDEEDLEVGIYGRRAFAPTSIGNPLDDLSEDGDKRKRRNGQSSCCRPLWKPVVMILVLVIAVSGIVASVLFSTKPTPTPPTPDNIDTQTEAFRDDTPEVELNSGEEKPPVMASMFSLQEWRKDAEFHNPPYSFAGDGTGTNVVLAPNGSRLLVASATWGTDQKEPVGVVSLYSTKGGSDSSETHILAQAVGSYSNQRFGAAISVNEDGNVVAVGSWILDGAGGPDVFVTGYNLTIYSIEPSTLTTTPQSEVFVATGESIIIELDASKVRLEEHLDPGIAVSLNGVGDRVAVGVPYYNGTGKVFVYEQEQNESWKVMEFTSNLLSTASPGDMYGLAVHLSGRGDILAAGQPRRTDGGRVVLYELQSSSWKSTFFLTGSDMDSKLKDFGSSLSLSSDGSILAIGAPSSDNQEGLSLSGYVAVFKRNSTATQEDSYGLMGAALVGQDAGELFGHSVSLASDGMRLSVGAPGRMDDNNIASGAALLYEINSDGTQWDMAPALFGQGAGSDAGYSVSISGGGESVAVGVPYVTSCTGVSKCKDFGTTFVYKSPSVPAMGTNTEDASTSSEQTWPNCVTDGMSCEGCQALIEAERPELQVEIVANGNIEKRSVEDVSVVQIVCKDDLVVDEPGYKRVR